jgi:7,8-dihydroneopterin 2',3'-cyclic phosphate phosphodiesterase
VTAIDNLVQQIPLLKEVADSALAEKVAQTWEDAIERSAFDGPDDIPQSLHIPTRSLLKHTNEVAYMANWMLNWSGEAFAVEVDRDQILAAAILHDVDKMVAFQQTSDGTFEYAAGYNVRRDHGPVGAEIARSRGIAEDVTELIRLHSPFGLHEGLPATLAGTIIHYADLGAADVGAIEAHCVPVHSRSHLVQGHKEVTT